MKNPAVSTTIRTPQLDAMHRSAVNRRGFMAAVGRRAEVELRLHFARREQEPRKSGFPKAHFWNRRIRSNTALTSVTDSTAVVTIAAPEFAQKLHGGTIRPREGKFLAIPARSEAANKSPRSFGNLRFVPTGRGGMLVADKNIQGPLQRGVKRIGSKQDGATYYFLVRAVTQRPDPKALPQRAAFDASLVEEGNDYLARERDRAR